MALFKRSKVEVVQPFRDDGRSWQAMQRHRQAAAERGGQFPVRMLRLSLACAGMAILIFFGLFVAFIVFTVIVAATQ